MISGKDAASGRSDLCPAGQELPDSDRPNDLMELDMFVTAKLKLLSGMVIVANFIADRFVRRLPLEQTQNKKKRKCGMV